VPLSATLHCVLSLLVQFFGLFLALCVLKSVNRFFFRRSTSFSQRLLETATKTTNFAPMLALLFVAVQQFRLQLQQHPRILEHGETIHDDALESLSTSLVHPAMYVCTYSLWLQLLLMVGLSCFLEVQADEDGLVI
jgi:hypothetical protein